jgi:selenide, water dikinase
MDACITPIRHGGLSQVQSTSVFYVLIDDPYMMVSDIMCQCLHNV